MPAYLHDSDVAAVKWVSGYPQTPLRGLPYINGLIVVNGETGLPQAIIDAGEITAARTAAASGACLRALGPDGWRDVALLGFGEQGRYHAKVVEALNPRARLHIYDPRVPAASDPKADVALDVQVHSDAQAAVRGTQIVITTGPIVKNPSPALDRDWLSWPSLLLPVDFDFYLKSDAVTAADLFVVDDIGQYDYYRKQATSLHTLTRR
jgi:ornithine cyclodeaminase/alanine dehydrogenase